MIGLYLPVVNLNLDNARLAREIEERVKTELRRLPVSEQKSVLERVAVDVLAGLNAPTSAPADPPRARKSPATPPPAPPSASETEGKQWEKILAYCHAHPTADGTFHNAEVAKGLFPEKMKKARNVAISTIYTATKRRSLGEVEDPCFVLLGKGKFRLANPEDKAKAREKR